MVTGNKEREEKKVKKYVSLNKRSKKARKEYYSKRRRTWGDLDPVTKSVPSGKVYKRSRAKQETRRIGKDSDDGSGAGSFLLPENMEAAA